MLTPLYHSVRSNASALRTRGDADSKMMQTPSVPFFGNASTWVMTKSSARYGKNPQRYKISKENRAGQTMKGAHDAQNRNHFSMRTMSSTSRRATLFELYAKRATVTALLSYALGLPHESAHDSNVEIATAKNNT